jgi:hypothetical protein
MPLNPVQVQYVNAVVRPMIERLILFRSELDAFVLDYDNQQTPLPTTAAVLDDNAAGTAPRTDAPTLTGAQVAQLRTFCAGMRDQISATALNTLVQTAVRSVEAILRNQS